MATVVVPFRGPDAKRRLTALPEPVRQRLATAMLSDVLDAAVAVGRVLLVAPAGTTHPAGVVLVPDPGHGQGLAVQAGLDAAVASRSPGPYLVVNADLPCVTARDLLALAGAVPDAGLAIVAAADGTTNALGMASAGLFEPRYGAGSAQRFGVLAPAHLVDVPNLVDDVDSVNDLRRIAPRVGAHTRSVLTTLSADEAA
jgi:2-phospho-L-lactate guanylyltransferase